MMQLNCYRNRIHGLVDAADFAVFKAESKYVIGVTANGDEYLMLPDRMSLKELLVSVRGLLRVSRSVLVARRYVERVTGTRDERCVHAAGKQYKLSRGELPERFESAAIENAVVFRVEQNRVVAITESREKWRLPAKVRLFELEQTVPGLMRVNRSVLVARRQVERVTGSRDKRCVRALGVEYSLSRELDPLPFRLAASENFTSRSTKIMSHAYFPSHQGLPAVYHQQGSSTHAV
ncbi:LytTR family transcriptional regulator DNA-binding domain-containing protein [Pseudomonas baetica]|uniref:LytTR family transcriptional regulator DNA-binding domain-containing protein n=1 Tax=Pseudomonas baetica TaxID=674054 RepID=UPI00240590CD|nr:LytTR family transcriptional regulator DNA-binding domain-containing protein [Pseudomonas baetica]MDF9779185.1 DNA-binding LytR/AlgR family response regulator [Pseudomonas baetica]